MIYQTKVIIDGKEYTSETSEGAYIADVVLSDCVSNKALDFGATGASSLQFSIINPDSTNYDGELVELWVSHTDDEENNGIEDLQEELEDEADDEIATDDDVESDEEEDEGEEGDELTDAEETESEEDVEELELSAYETLEGVEDTDPEEDEETDEAEEPEWIKIGQFNVYVQKAGNGQTILVCYDSFALMNDTYVPEAETATVSEMYADYCSQLIAKGISIDTEAPMPEGTITWNEKTSFRTAMGYFAGLNGGYADFDEDGVLTINQYMNSDVAMLKSETLSLLGTSSGAITVTGIECNGITSGIDPTVSFNNPFMTQEILDGIYNSYKGIQLSGQQIRAMWNPSLQAGTFIRLLGDDEAVSFLQLQNYIEENGADAENIADINSIGEIIPITSITVSFSGDAIASITAALPTITATDNPSVAPVDEKATNAKKTAEEAKESVMEIKKHVVINNVDGSVDIVDDNGTVLARYSDVTIIGKNDEAHIEQSFNSIEMVDKDGNAYVRFADLRNKNGLAEITETMEPFGEGEENGVKFRSYFPQNGVDTVLSISVDGVEITNYTYEDYYFVIPNSVSNEKPVTITYLTADSVPYYTMGKRVGNIGKYSVVNGSDCEASGRNSHAEGYETTASEQDAHAEGQSTVASGLASHAEGTHTVASGVASHAEGDGTMASYPNQHASGTYNKETEGMVEIVGNGSDPYNRSNARTLDWEGNEWIAGALSVGDKSQTRKNLNVASKSRTIINEFGTGKIVRNTSNTPSDSTVNLAAYEELGLVCFRMAVTARSSKTFTSNTAYVLCTIPSKYRPGGIRALNVYNTGTSAIQAEVNSSGEVTIRPKVANAAASATIYISGVWLI